MILSISTCFAYIVYELHLIGVGADLADMADSLSVEDMVASKAL